MLFWEKKHAWRKMSNYLYNEIWQVGFISLQQKPNQHTICGRINKQVFCMFLHTFAGAPTAVSADIIVYTAQ